MKIAKRDIAIIMIVLGALVAFCSYKFFFSGALDVVEEENAKQEELQEEIDKVAAVAGTETKMKNEVKKWSDEIDAMIAKYDPYYEIEDGILWMKQIEDDGIAAISEYGVGEPVYATTITGQGDFSKKIYLQGTTSYTMNYTVVDYDALKDFIDYIAKGKNKKGEDGMKTIQSMTFNVTEVGYITGTVTMTVYVMADGSVVYEAPDIPGVTLGVDPIFEMPENTAQ